jgi:hypothetical protein
MPPAPRTTAPAAADIDVEYRLLCLFGADPHRELPSRDVRRAVTELGLHPVLARLVVARCALLVPCRRRHHRLWPPRRER